MMTNIITPIGAVMLQSKPIELAEEHAELSTRSRAFHDIGTTLTIVQAPALRAKVQEWVTGLNQF